MSPSPYVDEHLEATRNGVPDPTIEVDCALAAVQDALDVGIVSALDAYDFLANWARLRRVQPELIDALAGNGKLARARAFIQQRGRELARLALTVANPEAWLSEAAALTRLYDEDMAPEARSQVAQKILADLDDAQLVLYAARQCGLDDAELDEQLAECDTWVGQHADLFLAASVHVQAVGLSLRSDLEEYDYGLAVTAIKFQDVLRAARTMEEELQGLQGDPIEPWPADTVQRLANRFERDQQLAAFSSWRKAQRKWAGKPLMAVAASETAPSAAWEWQWQPPQRDCVARLVVAPPGLAGLDADSVAVAFYTRDGNRAMGLAGQRVSLCGTESTVDETGKAIFPLARLLSADKPLSLRVGVQQLEWELVVGTGQ